MIDYGLCYRNFCQTSTNSQLYFIEENITSYHIFEKTIGYLSALDNFLYETYIKRANLIKESEHLSVSGEDFAEQSAVALCAINLHSIWFG